MTTQSLSDVRGPFDLLVVGGGITGAGVARDAARRGLNVLLVEQSDRTFQIFARTDFFISYLALSHAGQITQNGFLPES